MALLSDDEVRLRISTETTGGAAVEQLAQNIDQLSTQGGEAAPALGRLAGELRRMQSDAEAANASVGRSSSGLGQFVTQLKPIAGAIAAAFGVHEVARMAADFDSLVRSMGAIQGEGSKAAQEVGYITDAARRLGLDLESTAKTYTSWLASIKGTALEGEAGRQVFEAIAGSMSKLGKSAADTEGAMLALGQMVSKGTVSMEELRGQLAERLPGALQAAADGAGITTAQLIKMVESGSVLAEDLLPGMAAQLQKLYGNKSADGFVASWNRLTGAITEAVGRVAQTEVVMTSAGAVMGTVKETVLILGTGVITVAEGFGLLGKTIGATAAAITSGNWSGLREEISKMASESAERINELASKTTTATLVQKAMGQAVAESGAQAAAASPKFLQIQSAYTEVNKAAAAYTELAQKAVEARAAEAASAEAIVNEFGTESQQRAEAARQAEIQAAALQKLAEAKDAQAKISASQVAAVKEEADAVVAAGGKISQAKQDEINKLVEATKAKQEDAAKALAAAEAAKIHAAATEVETQTYADNSKRVIELRDAWKVATAAAEALHAAVKVGAATKEEAAAADLKAGQAAKLYRDATADATEAAQQRAAVQKAESGLAQTAIQNDLYRANTILEVAKQRGNEKDIAEAQIAVWRIELQINEAQAEASRKEAEGILLVAKAKRAELEASDALTPAKKAELAVMEASAKAKQLEAEKYDLVADRMRSLAYETKELKSTFGDLSSSADQAAASADRAAASYDGLASSIRAAGQAKDGFVTNTKGETVTTGPNVTDLAARNTQTPEQARVFEEVFNYYYQKASQDPSNYSTTQGLQYGAIERAATAAATAEAQRRTAASASSAASSTTTADGSGFRYGNAGRTVTVNINTSSGTRAVNTTDQASADALVRTLQELAGRS
ncbi:tape measure protein [Zoogloea sp. LCSB751]|uniref:tape measure protein n=1 Tax=Zoogloea sp. LCSB751 TaxID=1965277 RepID=UPI0009A4BB59|nr:tape measure protein [Zoogloea sp. LCSB751]